MDEFKIVIIVAILVSLATLATIIYISEDAINNAKIPNIERGTVSSKAIVSDNHAANYTVGLSSGQKLYILSNATFYNSIIVNQSYVFECRVDLNNKITIIDHATLLLSSNSTQ
jgi:hypothetical protein